MGSRYIALVLLFGCGGASSPAVPEPSPAPVAAPEPPMDVVEDAGPLEPAPEEEVAETPPPPPPKPKPPERVCADLERSQCMVTEGCEWHTVKQCLEQEKPKTLGD